jgi:hypothetical protein
MRRERYRFEINDKLRPQVVTLNRKVLGLRRPQIVRPGTLVRPVAFFYLRRFVISGGVGIGWREGRIG